LRHGIAEEQKPGSSDADRALTKEGREKLEAVLKRAAESGLSPSTILTSPYLRATQTAEIAAKVLKHVSAPVRIDALLPSSSPRAVWDEIRGYRSADQLLLAGHEPLLSQLVSYLLGAPSLQVDMKKAALVRIDLEGFRGEPHGVLKWMLTPKLTE
ncbi:MAG: phosphohistidine phosphatase SixA, partial [Acidobacteriota bacterium]|nr:phosphohistidine phosphatase SixA [Acidobacteriota bacterium]